MRYSEQVMEHFMHPRNVGIIQKADGFGQGGGGEHCPEDVAYVWINVRDDRIVEIKHKTLGCPVAIASSSLATSLAEGKTLDEALAITPEMITEGLGGVPDGKEDSVVAVNALHKAIADYRAKEK